MLCNGTGVGGILIETADWQKIYGDLQFGVILMKL